MNRPADSLEVIVREMTAPLTSYAFTPMQNAKLRAWADRLAALTPQPPAAVEQSWRDSYSELSDALGCDCMDSHEGRLARARRLAAKPAAAGVVEEARHWIERYAAGVDDELQMDRITEALAAHAPVTVSDDYAERVLDAFVRIVQTEQPEGAEWTAVQRVDAMRRALEAATPTPAAVPDAVRVDEVMVEAFCSAFWPSWKNPNLRSDHDRERVRAALKAALSAAPGEVLPCDVTVAPATTIRKGCKLSTLLQCIRSRAQPDPFPNADFDGLRAVLEPRAAAQDHLLCQGTRFKLSFDLRGRVSALGSFANELNGKWVALVDATDNRHLAAQQDGQS